MSKRINIVLHPDLFEKIDLRSHRDDLELSMAYRSGTYVASCRASRTRAPPTSSTIGRFRCGTSTRRSTSGSSTATRRRRLFVECRREGRLRQSLMQRLRNSRNMLLIVGENTRFDTDWVPFEIAQAIDWYELPIIVAYPAFPYITKPSALRPLWPAALSSRIDNGTAHCIHIPFKQAPIKHAIEAFDHDNYPLGGGLGIYSWESYLVLATHPVH